VAKFKLAVKDQKVQIPKLMFFIKGVVGAVIIFNHGLEFGFIFLVSDHPAHEKLIASKKNLFLSNN
jgi:hypothetical protein